MAIKPRLTKLKLNPAGLFELINTLQNPMHLFIVLKCIKVLKSSIIQVPN